MPLSTITVKDASGSNVTARVFNDGTGQCPATVITDGAGNTMPAGDAAARPIFTAVAGPAAHDAAVSGSPVLNAAEAKDFDGAALPNAVSAEGDVVRLAATLAGVQYCMLVNADGSAVGSLGTVTTVTTVGTLTGGGVAANAADSGNPVKVGAKYAAALPTYDDGDRTDLHTNENGGLLVDLMSLLRAEGDSDAGDSVKAGDMYDVVYGSNGTEYTVKRSGPVAINSATAQTVVAAVTAKQILVLSYSIKMQTTGTTIVHFEDDAGSPIQLNAKTAMDLSGAAGFGAVVRSFSAKGVDAKPTTSGQALMLKCSSAVSLEVEVTYIEIP